MNNRKIIQESIKIIENENGETVRKEEQTVYGINREPGYIKLYLDNLLYLKDLPAGLNTILLSLLKRMNYQNEVILNAGIKRIMSEEIKLSLSSINNAISKFVTAGILIRIEKGVYLLNPHLFGKGEWANISKIRLEVVFDPKGRTFKSVIEKKENKEEV